MCSRVDCGRCGGDQHAEAAMPSQLLLLQGGGKQFHSLCIHTCIYDQHSAAQTIRKINGVPTASPVHIKEKRDKNVQSTGGMR